MCCEAPEQLLVPPPVAEMLAHYRGLAAARGWDWGDELQGDETWRYGRFADLATFRAVLAELGEAGRPPAAAEVLARSFRDPLPSGFAVVRPSGIDIADPPPFALPGDRIPYVVLVAGDEDGSARITETVVDVDHPDLVVDGHTVRALEPVVAGRLHLLADAVSRWTVVDGRGGAGFPDGRLQKYDVHDRPFFHGNDVLLDVPAGELTVTVARGTEFRPVTATVAVEAGREARLEISPVRLYDAAAAGWYGGDLHVHMNYSGDLVCGPHDAAAMQLGEGLHLMNLVAGNMQTALVYDREAFEEFAGRDLPWTTDQRVARWGVEYRNDMLGHFHALNPARPPTRYQTGHRRSDHPEDWPPNAVAAREFRELGATVGYTHPVFVEMGDDGSPAEVFADHRVRSVEARELVADAAIGLVDSVDLLGPSNIEGTEHLYHRLLGCGLRLAATVGTDVFLSHSRSWNFSNPPGWGRAYANLHGAPLSVMAWQDAVRAGRTFATNGPWLELDVEGRGPGDTIELDAGGGRPSATARVTGLGVELLEIVGPDGRVGAVELFEGQKHAELTVDVEVEEPLWLAAVGRGGRHPAVLAPKVYAHTSPVWVEVSGRAIARPADAEWCLDWLDRLETLARTHGNFPEDGQFDDLVAVIDEARAFYRAIA